MTSYTKIARRDVLNILSSGIEVCAVIRNKNPKFNFSKEFTFKVPVIYTHKELMEFHFKVKNGYPNTPVHYYSIRRPYSDLERENTPVNKPIRKVVCAANKYGDIIICGARHHDKIMNDQILAIGEEKCTPTKGYQGFIDQFGVFMSRREAMEVAKAAKQRINMKRNSGNGKDLYSEGLY